MKIAILTCSLANSYSTNNLSKSGYVKKNLEFFYESKNMEYCSSQEQPDEEMRTLFNKNKGNLRSKCVLQSHIDLQDLSMDLAKARYFDSATGAIDTIYRSFNEPDSLSCQKFAEVSYVCKSQVKWQ
ncbi:hypothetical protein L1D31_13310 [Vibrio sp. Isolate23]|uniref:hypothetical protein n=1 Tax=Vibrio sp. Isolate23 TaxID=2908533 RepID=UPI001EFEC617|nr:hypothetical protein [Vibrio sp. Isolate23]MCG9683548.1 hypothetical protein [Vibrio sp. Isolate23]